MKKLVLYSLLLLLLSACQKPTIDVMGDNTVHYIKIGDGVKCDIDGDGKNDELWYSLENNKTDIKEFSINNKDFIGELEKLGVFLIDPDTLLYGLCDIDSSDDYLEIVIMDNGPSADYMSHFLRYKEGNLTYLGAVPNLLADIADNIGGDGKILSSFNLDIFQTWTAMGIYELSGDKLSFKEEEFYIPISYDYDGEYVKIHKTIYAFNEQDLNAKISVFSPSKAEVEFIKTDNKNWVCFSHEGNTGWLYIENYNKILQNGTYIEANELFSKLHYAG